MKLTFGQGPQVQVQNLRNGVVVAWPDDGQPALVLDEHDPETGDRLFASLDPEQGAGVIFRLGRDAHVIVLGPLTLVEEDD